MLASARSAARNAPPARPPVLSSVASEVLPRAASACACGGGCPRCAAAAPQGLIQREAAPDAEASSNPSATSAPQGDNPEQQDDSDESSGENCGAGEIGGQVYMCCFSDAPFGHRCWQVRNDVFNDCYAKNGKDHKAYELCFGRANFAACRCFGDKYCHCGGIV